MSTLPKDLYSTPVNTRYFDTSSTTYYGGFQSNRRRDMSQFKLGGVPDHAYDLFYELRDLVEKDGGKEWSKALRALLKTESPKKARRVLVKLRRALRKNKKK